MNEYQSYRDWPVYQAAMTTAMRIYDLTKKFPPEEKVSMVEPFRRASRSICAIIAESWRKRRYRSRFVAKLSDAESQVEETRVWLEFAGRCEYLPADLVKELDDGYLEIINQLSGIIWEPAYWYLPKDAAPASVAPPPPEPLE